MFPLTLACILIGGCSWLRNGRRYRLRISRIGHCELQRHLRVIPLREVGGDYHHVNNYYNYKMYYTRIIVTTKC